MHYLVGPESVSCALACTRAGARHATSHTCVCSVCVGRLQVRAYMCDGSLASMYHALWHGVPMLTVAMTQEQESNVARALRLGVGACVRARLWMCQLVCVCMCVCVCVRVCM